jgi:hypothetical protein
VLSVTAAGGVRFVRLTVTDVGQEARLAQPARHEFHKLTDVDTLRRLRSSPPRDVEQPPVDLEIDTTVSSASESARRTVAHFSLRPVRSPDRYPRPDRVSRTVGLRTDATGQPPQQPPPQQPPPPAGTAAGAPPEARPPTATVVRSLTVSSWPAGQVAGSLAALIARLTSNVEPHSRHRKS